MNPLRTCVIGVGHLGRIHARLLRQVAGAELVGVVDPVAAARESVAADLGTLSFADYRELLGRIDAAIIAVPTRQHHAVALDLLAHGIHVLVEKPITLNVGDAEELIREADSRGLALQVGHVERFNPAFAAAVPHLRDPKHISCVRQGPYTCRSTDIGVVLDLMIHDLDLVLTLVNSDVTNVEALGAAVFGPNEDWARARITFENGCVADLSASRVSPTAQRSMHVHSLDGSASIDLGAKTAQVIRHSPAVQAGTIDVNQASGEERSQIKDRLFQDYLPSTDLPVSDANAILEEQQDFVAAIAQGRLPRVSGYDGLRAIDAAERVLASIAGHRWDGNSAGRIGPRHESQRGILSGPHWNRTRTFSHRRAG